MASAKLKLKTSQVLNDGTHPIIIQVLKDNKKAITTVGASCFLEDWNFNTNLPKSRRLSVICQKRLLEMEELLFEGIDKEWSAKKIVNIFKGKDTKDLMFLKYYSTIKFDSKVGISTQLLDVTKIKKFKNFLGGKDVSFNEITFDLLKDYKEFLEEEGIGTGNRYLSLIRQVYNYAIENDDYVPRKNPFKSSLFKRKITSSTLNRKLNKNQIQELFKLNYGTVWKPSYKDVALDFWKFCFLMRGINFIELAVMKPEDISGDYFVFTREKLKSKSNSKQQIRIFPEARAIIDKYLDSNNDYVFPLLENGFDKDLNVRDYKTYQHKMTTLNSNLRKIGKDLKTDFNLTTMSARYSFVNLAKLHGVPFLYLQELIGHKTQSTTDIYLDVFPQENIDQYHREVINLVI